MPCITEAAGVRRFFCTKDRTAAIHHRFKRLAEGKACHGPRYWPTPCRYTPGAIHGCGCLLGHEPGQQWRRSAEFGAELHAAATANSARRPLHFARFWALPGGAEFEGSWRN